jgi:hypothetical protein
MNVFGGPDLSAQPPAGIEKERKEKANDLIMALF